MNHKLTVLVPTFNCERHLRRCLESVKWADEILICDSYSTDRTLDIAGDYTDRILQREYINSAKQKNWAIPQASHAWVLVIDSDEMLEPGLAEEIQATLAECADRYDGFRIPRKNLIFGKWITSVNHYPDYNTRLFRRDVGLYEDKEVHADIKVPGNVGTLQHAFIHYDVEDIEALLIKWGRYARYEGDQLQKDERPYRWYNVTFRPLIFFVYAYLITGAYRDGFRGFFLSVMWSFYVFMKHSRIWQLEWQESPEGRDYFVDGKYQA